MASSPTDADHATEQFDTSFNKVLVRYQGILLTSLSTVVLFFLVQIYFKLDKLLADNERFNTYTILNEQRWASADKEKGEIKSEVKELRLEIKEVARTQQLYEKEANQRWNEFMRSWEYPKRPR